MVKNTLSIDLESFVHRQLNVRKRTGSKDEEIASVIEYLLNIFDKYNTKITFFVLGEIYDWYPELIEKIRERGHEIGYHGHRHILIENRGILLEELSLSKKFLEKYRPIGFRAPRMFLKKEYLKILADFGFKYDSSTYGSRVEKIEGTRMKEIPVSLRRYYGRDQSINFPENMRKELLFKGVPYGSGLFLSLLGRNVQYFINLDIKNKKAANLFMHPWQFSESKENLPLPILQKLLYRKKINATLEYLLEKNTFFPLRDIL